MTTIDLTKLATDAVAKIAEGDTIQNAIETNIRKTLESVIRDATSEYSPFGKQLKEVVASTLQIDAGGLGLPGYNAAVLAIIKAKLENIVDEQLREQLSKHMDALLANAPKEISITKLVTDFKKWVREDRIEVSGNCTVIIENSHGFHWVHLDAKSYQEKYRCRFQIGINSDGKVFSLNDSSRDMKNTIMSKSLYGFPRDLFQMMAAGTKVVIDTMDINDSMEAYEDDEEEDI
ncbi:hypothetical protein [Azospirillum picis]|uniref:Uncharacterized protein n=1 Tax=Azospirillum picis TaxID=488438 RepID=A0ABU0MSW9_9PROT|nr:hypothetical protein [Azospirillum picis]MBP2302552.1 hypothetical protein [Azospirillum picis]MDQ0536206.1 hypothetical protein [Azospirillum picis]